MTMLETLLTYINSRGERITMQRRLVLNTLCDINEHNTVKEIQDQICRTYPEADIPETTVYRILQWLKEIGLVSQTDIGERGIVYALITEPYHHHLICLDCGSVTTIDDSYFSTLRDLLKVDYGFEARIEHMAIYGYCSACTAK